MLVQLRPRFGRTRSSADDAGTFAPIAASVATLAAAILALIAVPATAAVAPPATVDGPSSAITEFGNVSMAADGTGGLVYVKVVDGTPHLFASRFVGSHWGAPIRVDWDQPFDAARPRIAATEKGGLLVVWVTQVATVDGQIQRGLFSATLAPGAPSFGPSLLVDPNVGNGVGVDPSLAAASLGNAVVAYRVVTEEFKPGVTPPSGAVQLRPGDVMADIRVARLNGIRWSRLGAVNRNPAASMRPPSAANAPQVGVGDGGNAVVAWQEPDQTGAARIWVRRVFGSGVGPPSQVSPSNWEGHPILDDADTFALGVTGFDRAWVAARVAAGSQSSLGGPRAFLSSMGPSSVEGSGVASPPELLPGGAGIFGPTSIAAVDGVGGRMLLAFVAGGDLHEFGGVGNGAAQQIAMPTGPLPTAASLAATAVGPNGGGVVAYPTADSKRRPVVAVRQEFPSGALQTSLLSGSQSGPVAALSIGRSGRGDALIGFLQGEAGGYQVVGDKVGAQPAPFKAKLPKGWVRPRQVRLRWGVAASISEPITYGVMVDGRMVKQGLKRRLFRPRPAVLGSGVRSLRVVATDALGQQQMTKPLKLRVDGQAPVATAHLEKADRRLTLKVRDADSGLVAKATRVDFGDGSFARGGSRNVHTYQARGSYEVHVRARDHAGNRLNRTFEVKVR